MTAGAYYAGTSKAVQVAIPLVLIILMVVAVPLGFMLAASFKDKPTAADRAFSRDWSANAQLIRVCGRTGIYRLHGRLWASRPWIDGALQPMAPDVQPDQVCGATHD